MKNDLFHKRQRLGRHIPGFPKSMAIDYCETDRLLRHHLTEQIERLCDELNDLPVTRQQETTLALHGLNRLRAQLEEDVWPQQLRRGEFSTAEEERLLDFDLVLLEKIAGLQSCFLEIEAAGEAGEREPLFDRFVHGVGEVQDLMKKRARLWRELSAGD